MKHHALLLITTLVLPLLLNHSYALTPAEEAVWQQAKAQQGAEIRTIRNDAIEVFCTLDSSLSRTPLVAKEKADRIAIDVSGLSAANTVADMTFHPTVGFGTSSVRVDIKSHNENAVRVLVGLLASLGIHTDTPPDKGTLSPDELRTIIPGIDVKAYASSGTTVESIWDWARVETLSLLEKKPTVYKPSAARVKELLKRDRNYAVRYLRSKYIYKDDSSKEAIVNQIIPSFEGDEACPKKGAFMSSIFFVQLLSHTDLDERRNFIEGVIDTMVPPSAVGVDKFLFPDGRKAEFDLNYYILKEVYKGTILARRSLKY